MSRTTPSARETKFARSILTKNLQVKAGENVMIEGYSHSLPFAVALARETRRLKAFPLVLYEDETAFWDSIGSHEDEILGAAPAHEWAALGKTDVYIHMWGQGDKLKFGSLPEDRQAKILGFNNSWYKTAHKGGLRGTRLEIGRPFPNLAQIYGANVTRWMNQLIDASLVNPDWLEAVGKPIVRALERGRRLRIHDDEGTDLTLGLAHRKANLFAGRVTKADLKSDFRMLNVLPAGSLRLALDESVADGTFVANRSSYYNDGKTTGGEFKFRKGRLVSHSFKSGGELFERDYRTAGKGRDRPGILSIGLNPKLHDTPQVEDTEAGAILVSVGGNQFNDGGKNKARIFGFVINKGAKVEIDGRPLLLPS